MDRETAKKFELILYYMQKQICKTVGWEDFINGLDISEQAWHEIKLHLEANYGIKTYV